MKSSTTTVTLLLLTGLLAVSLIEAKKYKTLKSEKKVKELEPKFNPKQSKREAAEREFLQPYENAAVDENYENKVNDEEIVIRKKAKAKKPIRPKSKNFKVLTEYEQCKMECRRRRDLEDARQLEIEMLKETCRSGAGGINCSNAQLTNYIERLKKELRSAEKALNDAMKNTDVDEPSKSFIEVNVNHQPNSAANAPSGL